MKSISFHQAQGRCYLPGIPLNSLGSDEALSSYREVLRVGADFLAEIPKENDTVLNLYRWIAEYDLRQLTKQSNISMNFIGLYDTRHKSNKSINTLSLNIV